MTTNRWYLSFKSISHDNDVNITLFHAYTPVPVIDVRNNPIMEKMSGNLSYLKQYQEEKEGELQKAKEKLVAGGFGSSQVNYIFTSLRDNIAFDIIGLVREKKVQRCGYEPYA